MFIDKNSIQIKISGGDYISMGQYITEAKYEYNKLFGNDSGRNLSGKMVATLLGIFVKITLQFRPLTKSELEVIVPLLDSASQIVKYYDPKKKAYTEMQTYTGDYGVTNKGIVDNNGLKNDGFSCAFIAVEKRS